MRDPQINKQLIILSILIILNVFLIYTRSFKDDIPSCDGYIANVYLYILLGFLIRAFTILFIAKRRYPITTNKSLLFFGLSIIFLFILFTINPLNSLTNHAVWLALIISLSVSMYAVWRYSEYRGILSSSFIITLVLVSILTFLVHVKPEWVGLNWGGTLMVALLAGILAWTVPLFFKNLRPMKNYYKFLSAIFVFIFMLFILYNTKILRVKASDCTVPDYPKDSLNLFLDIMNLYGNVTMVR